MGIFNQVKLKTKIKAETRIIIKQTSVAAKAGKE